MNTRRRRESFHQQCGGGGGKGSGTYPSCHLNGLGSRQSKQWDELSEWKVRKVVVANIQGRKKAETPKRRVLKGDGGQDLRFRPPGFGVSRFRGLAFQGLHRVPCPVSHAICFEHPTVQNLTVGRSHAREQLAMRDVLQTHAYHSRAHAYAEAHML